MYPFSYTGVKIIHDQKLREAQEQRRRDAGQKTKRQRILRAFRVFLTSLHISFVQRPEESFPECARCAECSIS